ncbi:hypothetical protein M0R04_14745 [Candidatus Dojkabacteria bacterium]|jgi:hypothetical protein|nr:hypothetical protein [Candidatus Dojkabacteria bacterium]
MSEEEEFEDFDEEEEVIPPSKHTRCKKCGRRMDMRLVKEGVCMYCKIKREHAKAK